MSKGSSRRHGTNYAENWEMVFGKKQTTTERIADLNERLAELRKTAAENRTKPDFIRQWLELDIAMSYALMNLESPSKEPS